MDRRLAGGASFEHIEFNAKANFRIARLEFRVIANAGHWVMYEQPDAFDRAVTELLAPGSITD